MLSSANTSMLFTTLVSHGHQPVLCADSPREMSCARPCLRVHPRPAAHHPCLNEAKVRVGQHSHIPHLLRLEVPDTRTMRQHTPTTAMQGSPACSRNLPWWHRHLQMNRSFAGLQRVMTRENPAVLATLRPQLAAHSSGSGGLIAPEKGHFHI